MSFRNKGRIPYGLTPYEVSPYDMTPNDNWESQRRPPRKSKSRNKRRPGNGYGPSNSFNLGNRRNSPYYSDDDHEEDPEEGNDQWHSYPDKVKIVHDDQEFSWTTSSEKQEQVWTTIRTSASKEKDQDNLLSDTSAQTDREITITFNEASAQTEDELKNQRSISTETTRIQNKNVGTETDKISESELKEGKGLGILSNQGSNSHIAKTHIGTQTREQMIPDTALQRLDETLRSLQFPPDFESLQSQIHQDLDQVKQWQINSGYFLAMLIKENIGLKNRLEGQTGSDKKHSEGRNRNTQITRAKDKTEKNHTDRLKEIKSTIEKNYSEAVNTGEKTILMRLKDKNKVIKTKETLEAVKPPKGSEIKVCKGGSGLLVTTDNPELKADLVERLTNDEAVMNSFEIQDAGIKIGKILIHHTPKDITEDEIKSALLNDFGLGKDIGPLKAISTASDMIHWKVCVPASTVVPIIRVGKILIGTTTFRLSRFIEVVRCYCCQGFGHFAVNCNSRQTCSRCAGPSHDRADCKAKITRCANCLLENASRSAHFQLDTRHEASDGRCPCYREEFRKRLRIGKKRQTERKQQDSENFSKRQEQRSKPRMQETKTQNMRETVRFVSHAGPSHINNKQKNDQDGGWKVVKRKHKIIYGRRN